MKRIVLGIETSCDETAAAVVSSDRSILSNIVKTQLEEHRVYGGVVPEIASRSHVQQLDKIIEKAMDHAGLAYSQLSAVSATAGPGLIGGLMVGLVTGKAIAASLGKPLIAANHLEGHALSPRLTDNVKFPYLLLLVSGGHCQLVSVEGVGSYEQLGTTIDDAIGEAFDKTAKLLDLGYPGGPAIELSARKGNPQRFKLPRPMRGKAGCNFSFSGLKTAVRHTVSKLENTVLSQEDTFDIAASFQSAAGDVIADRTANAMRIFRQNHPTSRVLVLAGGVAANSYLRSRMEGICTSHGFRLVAPPPHLCTDNAAMIAWAGIERLQYGLVDTLGAPALARWPLSKLTRPTEPSLLEGCKQYN